MSTPQDDNQPVVWAVLVAVIVLAVGLAIGFGIAKSKKPHRLPLSPPQLPLPRHLHPPSPTAHREAETAKAHRG